MFDFFISYAREDGDLARALSAKLQASGWAVWIDEQNIPVSVPWMAEIEHAISQSHVYVALESHDRRSSIVCGIEDDLAAKVGVPRCPLAADAGLERTVAAAVQTRRDLPPRRVALLTLQATARTWSDAGRSRSMLARGTILRVFRGIARDKSATLTPVSRAFLRESVRRHRRRVTLTLIGAVVTPLLVGALALAWSVQSRTEAIFDEANAGLAQQARANFYLDWNPYLGLEVAIAEGGDKFADRQRLAEAVDVNLPDAVVAPGGSALAVAQREVRSPVDERVAKAEGSSIVVQDRADAASMRRLVASGNVSGLAWSPDGEWIAATVGRRVEVISPESGVVTKLVGSPEALTSVSWEGRDRLTAQTETGAGIGWRVSDATWIAGPTAMVARDGVVHGTEFVVADDQGGITATSLIGGTRRSRTLPDSVGITSGIDAHGTTIAASLLGDEGGWIRVFDSQTLESRDIEIPGCAPIDVALDESGSSAFVACVDFGAAKITLADDHVSVVAQSHQLLAVAVSGESVAFGTSNGGTLVTTTTDFEPATYAYQTGCRAPIRRIAWMSGSAFVFHAGDDTGIFGCGLRGTLVDNQWGTHRIIFPANGSPGSRSVAVNKDGSLVAYGMNDGRVRVLTTKNFETVLDVQVSPIAVAAVDFDDQGDSVVVVTRQGAVASIQLPFTAESDADRMLDLAMEELERAIELGLYTRQLG